MLTTLRPARRAPGHTKLLLCLTHIGVHAPSRRPLAHPPRCRPKIAPAERDNTAVAGEEGPDRAEILSSARLGADCAPADVWPRQPSHNKPHARQRSLAGHLVLRAAVAAAYLPSYHARLECPAHWPPRPAGARRRQRNSLPLDRFEFAATTSGAIRVERSRAPAMGCCRHRRHTRLTLQERPAARDAWASAECATETRRPPRPAALIRPGRPTSH
jgi:hypothetical protein